MVHPAATVKMHHATVHHSDDLVDLVECGVRAADGVPSSPFAAADAVIIQREMFRPTRKAGPRV